MTALEEEMAAATVEEKNDNDEEEVDDAEEDDGDAPTAAAAKKKKKKKSECFLICLQIQLVWLGAVSSRLSLKMHIIISLCKEQISAKSYGMQNQISPFNITPISHKHHNQSLSIFTHNF